MATFDTVANIISEVAVAVGLGAVSNAFASQDPNIVQMRGELKRVGRQLVLENDWLQLVKEHTFVTTSASSYSLPADFVAMVPQTGWNRTSQQPLEPLSAQRWQRLKASADGVAYTALFRPRATTLELWPQPPVLGQTIAFEYRSSYWVQASGSSAADQNAPAANTDTIKLELELIVPALKLAFLQAKGFDATAAQNEYDAAYEALKSVNTPAGPVLSLSGRDTRNSARVGPAVPISGYGSGGGLGSGGLY